MGSQRVGHVLATEQQRQLIRSFLSFFLRNPRTFGLDSLPAHPSGGWSAVDSPVCPVPDFGRFTSGPDAPSQLQGSSLEDLLCSHAPLSSEDDASPGCVTSSQVPFKAFLSSPELRASRGSDRKLSPLLSPLQDPLVEKTLLETREVGRPKKVCFSESSLPSGDRTRRSYYLNEIQSFTGTEKDGRIVGEIAFQLDRRILAYVFPGVTRLYGFTVSNIPEKIKQTSIKSLDGSVDEKKLRELTHRYLTLTARLERLGYNRDVHPVFSEFLINTYGILKQRPDLRANPLHSSPAALRKLVIDVVPPKFLGDSLLLLNCLCELSKEDSRPLFAW
nr:speriolin-like protein isoform X1 [Ovis aries]